MATKQNLLYFGDGHKASFYCILRDRYSLPHNTLTPDFLEVLTFLQCPRRSRFCFILFILFLFKKRLCIFQTSP